MRPIAEEKFAEGDLGSRGVGGAKSPTAKQTTEGVGGGPSAAGKCS